MAIADIILMSDSDVAPIMQVGSIVKPINSYALPHPLSTPKFYTDFMPTHYAHAIVVSMAPFILVSESSDMRWQDSVVATNFKPIGMAMPDAVNLAMTRLSA